MMSIDNQFMLEARGLSIRKAREITQEANARPDGMGGAFAGLAASLTLQTILVSILIEKFEPGSVDGEAELVQFYENVKKDAIERWHKPDLKDPRLRR